LRRPHQKSSFLKTGEGLVSADQLTPNAIEPQQKWLFRVGGLSGLILGVGYLAIIALYIPVGAPPSDVAARLAYLAGNNRDGWEAILAISVLTDLLLIPFTLALYEALKGINRNLMLLASACIGLFVILDLAITWPNYAVLITLSDHYAAAASTTAKAAIVIAATAPALTIESGLFGFYAIVVPGIGILFAGLVMRKGIFGRVTAWAGIATGVFAALAVVGPFVSNALGMVVVLASLLTMLWVMLAGHRLYRLGAQ
jgi:Domain of unknown function (DUF4386)